MTVDPSQDYLSLDGLETLELTQGAGDPLTVDNCLRGTLSVQDIRLLAGSVGTQPGDVVMQIWAAELPAGVMPGAGNSLADSSGAGYTIQSVDYRPLTQVYRCVCRLKVVA